jgi:hypothetical protein
VTVRTQDYTLLYLLLDLVPRNSPACGDTDRKLLIRFVVMKLQAGWIVLVTLQASCLNLDRINPGLQISPLLTAAGLHQLAVFLLVFLIIKTRPLSIAVFTPMLEAVFRPLLFTERF